eukprot:5112967-Pleurochrysis_carterae.AAC.1
MGTRRDSPLLGADSGPCLLMAYLHVRVRERNSLALPVALDDGAQLQHVGHPLDKAALLVERRDRVAAHAEPAAAAVDALVEQPIDRGHHVHHARVLAQVVLGLAQKDVAAAVGAPDDDLLGPLQRSHHLDAVLPAVDARRLRREGRVALPQRLRRLGGGQVGVDRHDEREALSLGEHGPARAH